MPHPFVVPSMFRACFGSFSNSFHLQVRLNHQRVFADLPKRYWLCQLAQMSSAIYVESGIIFIRAMMAWPHNERYGPHRSVHIFHVTIIL